jgi:hypothetical protein
MSVPAGTRWTVRTSQGFDALCALNVLSGDEYYVKQYPAEAKEFARPAYEGARRAALRAMADGKTPGQNLHHQMHKRVCHPRPRLVSSARCGGSIQSASHPFVRRRQPPGFLCNQPTGALMKLSVSFKDVEHHKSIEKEMQHFCWQFRRTTYDFQFSCFYSSASNKCV